MQVPTLTFTRATDANGETTFENLPTGPYQFRVQATGVEPGVGKFDVQAGQVTSVAQIPERRLRLLRVERDAVVIEDRYDFKLTATFETHVPARSWSPIHQLLSHDRAGATYVGEYTLTNHGLVAGDNLRINTSSAPAWC